ncbi:uncharacterized protein PFL1_04431 [Pseudozyma flocculosa PF-1]|uniref:G-protein coupled receptors family 1 profile domain-containing protein n=2 Tax=Pseudozyma flocculosa TaxID=84751 RepID=A0A5C3FBY0_9BASI|nr:uncharacterized protein PFL1_04431 [Pseudozyma flocculosa PF-1]EPQ28104.1 hypothetical protein PFL1_04431 [Pseudozyma flocculosa PF-1]SPO41902.1 uncharacterized protein PSFLO_07384 [Pseudozyma flocculosa]
MSLQTLTVTAVPAFQTGLVPDNGRNIPHDLIVTSVKKVNSTLPFLLTAAMGLGIIVADWSLHLPWEWRLLRTRSRWKLSHLAYFCSRIGGFSLAITAVLHQFVGNFAPDAEEMGRDRWHNADFACSSVKKASNVFAVLSIAGSTGILLLRCLALWRFNRAVMVPLCLLWLATPVFIFVNVFNLNSKSQANGLYACQNIPPRLRAHPVLSYVPWFVLPVFDSTILVLSLVGLHRATAKRTASKLERMFRFDNLLYYVVSLILVLPIPIYYLAVGRDGRMWPYTNLYITLSSALSCRIFINLWKAIGQELASANTYTRSRDTAADDDAYSTQRRTHGANSLGVPTVELRAHRSAMTNRSQLTDDEGDDGELGIPSDFDNQEASSSDKKDPSVTTENKVQHHRVVPQWTDVDPDLAFSLRGAQMLDDVEKNGPGLQSSP